MAGISSKAPGKLQNKHKYNGNELQRGEFSDGVGLEVYDFNTRTLDPQIGRFLQIDPAIEEDQESWTPYHFGFNNPVLRNDPDGKNPIAIYRILRILYDVAIWAQKKGVVPQRAISIGIKDNTNVVTSAMPLELVKDFQQQGQVVKSEGTADDKSSEAKASKEDASTTKRSSNKLEPDQNADGDHSTYKRDDNGDIYKYQEWKKNDKNPNKFDPGKRFDGGTKDGKPGTPHKNNRTGEEVETPHMNEPKSKDARRPEPKEFPNNKRFNSNEH